MKNPGVYGMRKVWHYVGNLAEIVIAFFLYGILQRFYFFPKSFHFPYRSFVFALATVLVLALIFGLYKWQLKQGNDWDFNDPAQHWRFWKFLVAIAGFFLITFLGAFLLRLVGSHGSEVSTNQEALDRISQGSGNLFRIMVVFVAPFCEEVIFRGMFFNTFFTRETAFNKWVGIVVNGFVFAYAHDPRITKFILVYWVLGCVLAWVYLQTKDLRYSMMTHMAYNAIGFLV